LLDLHWLTLPEARELDLPTITREVIDMVENRMRLDRDAQMKAPAPYFYTKNGKWAWTHL
jgi:hypothetical protein